MSYPVLILEKIVSIIPLKPGTVRVADLCIACCFQDVITDCRKTQIFLFWTMTYSYQDTGDNIRIISQCLIVEKFE